MSLYVSTRDVSATQHSYNDVLLQGLAPDKGLYVPVDYPQIDYQALASLVGKPYVEIFRYVKGLFLGDEISTGEQATLAQNAFSADKFPDAGNGNLTPVSEIDDDFFIQQLSLGPTAAFKDMALQPLGQDMQYVLAKRGESLVLLGATSGDTGSAAEAAVKGLKNLSLFMLSPEIGMSDFQKAQMGMLSGGNIFNISIPGRFDDCQDIVKAIKQDEEFSKLGAVNSINWGRIASQVPYYVAGYLQVVGTEVGKPIDFVVPTGNFGNVLAGYIAKQMGVPIRRLIVATNENSVVDTLIQTGSYDKPASAKITTSPSMDITVASNYERLLYDVVGRSPEKVRAYMDQFEKTGKVGFKDVGLADSVLRTRGFDSGVSTASDRLESIQWAQWQSGIVIDPHTADAVTVARTKKEDGVPIVCMSTALPVKFEPTIREALGFVPARQERFQGIEEKSLGGFTVLPNDAEAIKAFIRSNSGSQG
ncbi:MAG: threonine synthase [Candidatus Saccharimonadales bacterium]